MLAGAPSHWKNLFVTSSSTQNRFDYHPQTQSKIGRWHQAVKNRILLETTNLQGDLEAQVKAFVEYYNRRRHHEILNNITPPTLTWGGDKPSCWKEKRSNERSTNIDSCDTAMPLHNIFNLMSQGLLQFRAPDVSNHLMTGTVCR
jgi:hypothetical protein